MKSFLESAACAAFNVVMEDAIRSIGWKVHRFISLRVAYILFVRKHLYICLLIPLVKLKGQLQELGCHVMFDKICILKGC